MLDVNVARVASAGPGSALTGPETRHGAHRPLVLHLAGRNHRAQYGSTLISWA
jgi:hypothetical protein